MKYIIQYAFALILFVFSTFAAWYEGSAILDDPWEWKYTALFSEMFHGTIINSSDISQLDFFLYAAKFNPIFPLVMVLSCSYIFILTGYLLKDNRKRINIFLLSFGLIYVILGVQVSNSPTTGGKYFTIIFLIIGIVSLALSILKMTKRTSKVNI